MKTRWFIVPLALAMLIAAKGFSAAEKEGDKKEFKATCPVSGKPAGEDHVIKLKNGDKVYFCCDNCPKDFEANPKKYNAASNRQLLETGQIVQVACPITGKPVTRITRSKPATRRSASAARSAKRNTTKASDEEKLKMLFAAKAFKKGFTHQTMCPVSGKPIDPAALGRIQRQESLLLLPELPGRVRERSGEVRRQASAIQREAGEEGKKASVSRH